MKGLKDIAGKTTLITGASSGIGREFAKAVAIRGSHVVLTGRNKQRLIDVAGEIREKHGTARSIEVVAVDFEDPESPNKLFNHLKEKKLHIDILINNAGFGKWGFFEDESYEKSFKMNLVNMSTVVSLCHLFIPAMLEKESGGIINVASTAGFQPIPFMANYAATKAYVLHLSLALWQEYFDRGITVTAFCPGWTKTGFIETAGIVSSKTSKLLEPRQIIGEALDGLLAGDPLVIPEAHKDFVQMTLAKFIPLKTRLSITANMFKPK